MLSRPKRMRRLSDIPADASPAALFAASLGDSAPQFHVSLRSLEPAEILEAEQKIAASSPVLQNEAGGGVFHYRNAYPRDGMLRLWSGLILMGQGQNVRALSEFQAALSFGCNHWRVSWYLAQTAERLRAVPLALRSLRDVIRAAPDFSQARRMLEHSEHNRASR
jgi:hypothetical protein